MLTYGSPLFDSHDFTQAYCTGDDRPWYGVVDRSVHAVSVRVDGIPGERRGSADGG